MTTVTHTRQVEQLIKGMPTSDGAGVNLTRVLTHNLQKRLDPYLMLDHFSSDDPNDYIAGFPDHPHRGFETITFMIQGRMLHHDSAGHRGLLEDGGVQWMTAAHGVIHSEIPQQENGVMEGFQLWLNLPAKDKLNKPWYKDFAKADLPHARLDNGVDVTVIAGHSHGVDGAVTREVTEPTYLDVKMPAGTRFEQQLPDTHNAFIFVFRGSVSINGKKVALDTMAILANDAGSDGVVIDADEDARFLLIAGKPLNEPIVQYGPFVMNTEQQIIDAMNDYRAGRLGEKADVMAD